MPRLLLVLAGLALVLALAWFLSPGGPGVEAPHASAPERAAPSGPAEAPDAPGEIAPHDVDDGRASRSAAAPPTALPEARAAPSVAVLDAVDGRHLEGIELRRSSGPIAHRGSWTASYVVLPRESDEVLARDLASPIELGLGPDAPEALWIVAPGHVPHRFLRPAHPLRGTMVLRLEREAGIEVRLRGSVPAPEEARIKLYAAVAGSVAASGLVRGERPALSPVRFDGLPSGGWCVALEQVPAGDEPGALLASSRVELARGEWTTVVLDAASVEDALRPALLTLRFPESWRAEPGASAALHPEAGNALRYERRQSLGPLDGETVGPLGLVPGLYALCLEPGHVVLPVDLPPGERRELQVPELGLHDVAITVREADGSLAQIQSVAWRTTVDWDGSASRAVQSPMLLTEASAPLRLRAAAGPLELTLFRPEGELRRVTVDVRGAREVEVVLPAETWIELDLSAFEDNPDHGWFSRVRVHGPDGELEIHGLAISSSPEELTARLGVDVAGAVELEFPALPSHGDLRPRRVEVVAGSITQVRLDVSDLADESPDRR